MPVKPTFLHKKVMQELKKKFASKKKYSSGVYVHKINLT
jgi:hypothetical protein